MKNTTSSIPAAVSQPEACQSGQLAAGTATPVLLIHRGGGGLEGRSLAFALRKTQANDGEDALYLSVTTTFGCGTKGVELRSGNILAGESGNFFGDRVEISTYEEGGTLFVNVEPDERDEGRFPTCVEVIPLLAANG